LSDGDFLTGRVGSVGEFAVYHGNKPCGFSDNLLCFRLQPEFKPRSKFLLHVLNSSLASKQIAKFKKGSLQGVVNQTTLQSIIVPDASRKVEDGLASAMDNALLARQQKLAQADALLAGFDGYLLAQLGLTAPAPDARQVFAVRLGQLRDTVRVNADYFHPERILAIRAMEKNRKTMRVERLRDIADFIRDAVPAETSDNYLGLANVQSHTGELVESTEEDGEGLCFRYAPQDVLFARLRPYLNKVHRAEKAGVCSTEFHVIRIHPAAKPQDEIRADYLATVLRSSLVLAQTCHMMTGNTHPRLANEDVVNLVVPIPDPKIQENIAAEVTRRRTEARRLRAEAETEWTAAKKHFEEQLLGTAKP
jgi:type I restriction enzyme, S subunit